MIVYWPSNVAVSSNHLTPNTDSNGRKKYKFDCLFSTLKITWHALMLIPRKTILCCAESSKHLHNEAG